MDKINIDVVTIHPEAIANPKEEIEKLKQSKYPNSLNLEVRKGTPGYEHTSLVTKVEYHECVIEKEIIFFLRMILFYLASNCYRESSCDDIFKVVHDS